MSLIDIFPTLCEAAGVEVPPSVEGKSLLGLYQGHGRWDREQIFASFVSPAQHRLNIRCVRTTRYKLVHHLTTDEIELYDLEGDPYELRNLAGLEEFEGVQRQLAARLAAWRARSEDGIGKL